MTAYANNSRFGYHNTPVDGAIINRCPSYFDDDDSAILDPEILDADIMQSPVDAQLRKASFPNTNGVLSPAESHGWDYNYCNGLPTDPSSSGPSNAFHDEHNAFVRHGPAQVPAFAHPQHVQSWSFEQGSGHCTPTDAKFARPPPLPPFEGVQGQQYVHHHRHDSARNSFSQPPPPPQHFNGPYPEGAFIPAPQVQTPMSPHSHQDWMSMAQQEVDGRPVSKRMRAGSPARTSVDLQRKDGIRKKNGRIDIPQERNIQTIDELIDNTNDENMLKELKQQKRLLRNREAALASRQRKKKHTEDLETQSKDFTRTINGLEAQIQALELDRHNQERSHHITFQRYQEAQRTIETMHDEQRVMAMKHNEETSTLRKRIQILMENGPAPAMSAEPSSAGLTDFNANMEALTMDTHTWDDLFTGLPNDTPEDFTFESKPESMRQSPVLEQQRSSSTAVPYQSKKSTDCSSEQPVASGLVFFLLLCGAFVASRPASSRPSGLPEVPEDVRAAAPAVLDNLLGEVGPSSMPTNSRAGQQTGFEPPPSGLTHSAPSRSRLDHMHHQITSPTKQQEIEVAFSLSTAQFASIANMDYNGNPHVEPLSRPRRKLGEALASMEHERPRHSKAEVYTRSLLWDQIPSDVVEQFREMVRDYNEIEARQQQQRPTHDDMFAFKVES